MQKKVWIVFIVLLVLISTGHAQLKKSEWVDSVFSTLDVSGKIGQLLMVPTNSYANPHEIEKTISQLKKFKIGGVMFTGGGPISQANVTNHLQQTTSVPLLIAMNAEAGLGSVLDSAVTFPPPIMLGSVRDDSLIFFLGAEIGRQLKILGAHINFGPTSNASNLFAARETLYQSFRTNMNAVAPKVAAFQSGLSSVKILSVESAAVHVSNKHDQIKQEAFDVVPFYIPRSISSKLSGLVISSFSDSTHNLKKFSPGDAEVFAFKNGGDIMLMPQNIPAAIRKLRKAVRKNKELELQLDNSTKKILSVKFDAELNKKSIINTENLVTRINTSAAIVLKSTLSEKSIVLLKNDEQLLPLKQLDNLSLASISVGGKKENSFTNYLSKYTTFTHFEVQRADDTVGLVQKLRSYNVVVVAFYPNSSNIESEYSNLLQKVNQHSQVIAINFDSPVRLSSINSFPVIIQAYADSELLQNIVPQLLFGAKKIDGVMPVSIDENIKQGQGIQTSSLERISYAIPEAEGFDSKTLQTISVVANEAITQRAAPGCQVLVARHGKIIYDKSFGSKTYENKNPVNDQTIYDLASLTKVSATLQAVMFLYEKGLIDINKKASVYLPELLNTNKKDIILKDILTHQSGLFPFLLMWPQTVHADTLLAHYYSPMKSESYPLHVAPNLFASTVMKDSIWQWVLKSEMLVKPARTPYSTRYSDLGFMILHRIVERLVNQPMEDFLSQNLYEPLGANTVGYLPLTKYSPMQIAPTEKDTIFRKAIVLGTVHDERAAMVGGVAGHAGLFGSGTDLIKLGQLFLQKGKYGGQTFYKPETIELFAQKQFDNSTRGMGWAKSADPNSPSSRFLSPKGFGHTGFTGTCMWVDPEFDLVFVFLSNSRFPNRSSKLNTSNIRSRIQDAVYQSIFNYCQYGDALPDEKLMQYLRKLSN